jgi:hypothetical protein
MVDYDPDGDHAAVQPNDAGWYYQFAFPGCLPDSEPAGPYGSEEEAVNAARELYGNEWEEDT